MGVEATRLSGSWGAERKTGTPRYGYAAPSSLGWPVKKPRPERGRKASTLSGCEAAYRRGVEFKSRGTRGRPAGLWGRRVYSAAPNRGLGEDVGAFEPLVATSSPVAAPIRTPRRALHQGLFVLRRDGMGSMTNPGGQAILSRSVFSQGLQQPLGQPQVVEPHILPPARGTLNYYALRPGL